uniref:Putative conserved secreted protein n=1 Tax=Ixodes scapularis TaxID=6945 RepID=A0A4D5SA03_IXOSC
MVMPRMNILNCIVLIGWITTVTPTVMDPLGYDPTESLGITNVRVVPLSPTKALVSWRAKWHNAFFKVSCFSPGQEAVPSVSVVLGEDHFNRSEKIALLSELRPSKNYTIVIQGCLMEVSCGIPTETWVITQPHRDSNPEIKSLRPTGEHVASVPDAPSVITLVGGNSTTAAVKWTFRDTETVKIQASLDNSTWLNCTDPSDNCQMSSFYDDWLPHNRTGMTVFTHLMPGHKYNLWVRACNNVGCGAARSSELQTGMKVAA